MCPCYNILMFFKCFYCFPCLIWFFEKIFPHFYNQIKHKAGNRFYPPNKNNKLIEILQTTQTKRQRNLWEFKIFVCFTHIGYKRTHFRISCVSHPFILCTIQTYNISMKVLLKNKLNDFYLDNLCVLVFK